MTLTEVYEKSGKPLKDRSETIRLMKAVLGQDITDDVQLSRPPLAEVFGTGPMLISDIPAACFEEGVHVGIDEAGRGSVLGPMTYGAAFWNKNAEHIPKDFNDSKQLSEETRARLLQKILLDCPQIGFCLRILQSSEIARNMLRRDPYNLNQMSHDAAAGMVEALLAAGVKIDTCYVDTVGNAASYQRRLEQQFPGVNFVVECKADAKYAPCSAASVGEYTELSGTLPYPDHSFCPSSRQGLT